MVNHRIRPRGHVPGPLVGDIAAVLKDAEECEERLLGLVWDFVSAHRIVAVHPSDWGLQACTLADRRGKELGGDVEVFVNTVGTFGFSTAGHWWGRLAAMLIRLAHYAWGRELAGRIMIFADDGLALFPASTFRRSASAVIALYAVLGFDLKWPKIRGGIESQWIGYWLQLSAYWLWISEKRRNWVVSWIDKVLAGKDVEADFDSGLGR